MPIVVKQEKDKMKRAINNVNAALSEMTAAYEKYKKAQAVLDSLQQSISAPNVQTEIDRIRSLSGK
jgi:hypothetical protein